MVAHTSMWLVPEVFNALQSLSMKIKMLPSQHLNVTNDPIYLTTHRYIVHMNDR